MPITNFVLSPTYSQSKKLSQKIFKSQSCTIYFIIIFIISMYIIIVIFYFSAHENYTAHFKPSGGRDYDT